MTSQDLNPTRARVTSYLANSAPNPDDATRALQNFPDPLNPHQIFVPCWFWRGALSRGRPTMMIRPHTPKHPVTYFYAPGGMRRFCENPLCVNPMHFTCHPKEPAVTQHPLAEQAEGELEKHSFRTMTLRQALVLCMDVAPSRFTLMAYRHLRQVHSRRP